MNNALRELWRIEGRHFPASCTICGLEYVHSSENDRKQHQWFHRQVASTLPPRPDKRISALAPDGDLRVDVTSPKWMHVMVYERARRLMKEQHYDAPQWSADNSHWQVCAPNRPTHPHAFLLIEQGNIAVGIAGFGFGKFYSKIPTGWHMLFAWVAPEWRRQGILSRRWLAWRETYGDFTVESPVSRAMVAFLTKQEHPLTRITAAVPRIQSWQDLAGRY